MTKCAPSASPKQSQRERQDERHWWKMPAIIAAVIVALATIGVALIHPCTASTPQPSGASHTKQETHGSNSPAITGVQGDVTITYGISPEQYGRLAVELGVTDSALKSFFNILEQQSVAPGDLDSTLRDIAKNYKTLQERLQAFTSDDPVVSALKREASHALNAGEFMRAETLLNQASAKDLESAQQLQETATKRLLSAASSKAENGQLKNTQLRYTEAVTYYRQAAELVECVPNGPEEILALYLNEWGTALYQGGDYRSAEPPLTRALAIREKVLGPEHPDVATSLNNLASLYRAQGRYAEAEPPLTRALAIREKVLGPEHPDVATSLNNLAGLYATQGRYAEAEPRYQQALAIQEKALGPDHPQVATYLGSYAALLRATHRTLDADQLDIRAKTIRAKHTQANPGP
jgi:tetratricopeptide (TPR) repeat protein